MTKGASNRLLIFITTVMILAGCNSMSSLHRSSEIIIDIAGQEGIGGTGITNGTGEGQEGIGGSGLDPDGIGGTGIIGLVSNTDQLSVGGIDIPLPEQIAIYLNGGVADAAAITSGQVAAVRLDQENFATEIHLFDQQLGITPFLNQVSQLIVRGQIETKPGTAISTINGIALQVDAATSLSTDKVVQIQASAVASGKFRVDVLQPIGNLPERPEPGELAPDSTNPTILQTSPKVVTKPASDVVKMPPVQAIPVPVPSTLPDVWTRPQPVETPVIPQPPVKPAKPITPVKPAKPIRPVSVVKPQPVRPIKPTVGPEVINPPAAPEPPAPPEPQLPIIDKPRSPVDAVMQPVDTTTVTRP